MIQTIMAWTIFTISARLLYRRLGIFLLANLLWILTSIPLVTMPAAAGGLFYLINRVIADERELDPQEATISDFWVGFRSYWQPFSLLGLADVAIFILLGYTTYFYWQSSVDPLGWLVGPLLILLLTFTCMQLYLFPLRLAFPSEHMGQIFRRAFFQVLAKPMDSIMLVIWLLMLTIVCVSLGGPVLLLLFSAIGLVQTYALRVFRIERGELPKPKVKL